MLRKAVLRSEGLRDGFCRPVCDDVSNSISDMMGLPRGVGIEEGVESQKDISFPLGYVSQSCTILAVVITGFFGQSESWGFAITLMG